ncbi:MAG: T9SS type A sorting domain-containing protein [Chitinophagales bacterium]
MKTTVPFKKTLLVFFLLITFRLAFAVDHLIFKSPTLVSGTALKLNAVYRFDNIMPNVYALVSIDSLINGATVPIFDDNSAGTGYTDAFQPQVTIPGDPHGNLHESYAVFKITFYNSLTNGVITLQTVGATALDIDGNADLKEFDEIDMNGGNATYMSTTPDISVVSSLNSSGKSKFRGDNILGTERTGIDTSALGNMFSVTNSTINSFKIKFGAKSKLNGSSSRQFSLYMKGFQYPNQLTLPVKLIDFSAQYDQTNVSLTWKSAQEIDFNYYELEHSTDGNSFTTTSVVFGAAANGEGAEYNYVDKSVAGRSGLIYYRLKMVDIDGHFTYSPVRIVRLGEEKTSITLTAYPNPVSTDLRITLPASWQNKHVNIELFNSNGQHVNNLDIANSSQTESISVASLQRGIYFVKASCGTETASQQIIKN